MAKTKVPEWIRVAAKVIKDDIDTDGDISEKALIRIIAEHAAKTTPPLASRPDAG